MTPQIDTGFIPAKSAAHLLGLSVNTLRSWRYSGKYAEALKPHTSVTGRVFYKEQDVRKFALSMIIM